MNIPITLLKTHHPLLLYRYLLLPLHEGCAHANPHAHAHADARGTSAESAPTALASIVRAFATVSRTSPTPLPRLTEYVDQMRTNKADSWMSATLVLGALLLVLCVASMFCWMSPQQNLFHRAHGWRRQNESGIEATPIPAPKR